MFNIFSKKITLILLVLLVVSLVSVYFLIEKNGALKLQIKQQQAQIKILDKQILDTQKQLKKLTEQANKNINNNEKIKQQIYKNNKSWSNTSIPADVIKLLESAE